MNITKPVTQRVYTLTNLNNAYLFLGEQSTQMVAKGRRKIMSCSNNELDDKTIIDYTASLDIAWSKRGHDSQNTIVSTISRRNDEVVDFQTLSRKCKGCQCWESKKDFSNTRYSNNIEH